MSSQILKIINNLNDKKALFRYRYSECYHCSYTDMVVPNNSSINIPLNLQGGKIESFVDLNGTTVIDRNVCKYNFTVCEGISFTYTINCRDTEIARATGLPLPAGADNTYRCDYFQTGQCTMYMLPFFVLLIALCLWTFLFYAVVLMYRHRILQRLAARCFPHQIDSLEDLGNPNAGESTVLIGNSLAKDDYRYDENVTGYGEGRNDHGYGLGLGRGHGHPYQEMGPKDERAQTTPVRKPSSRKRIKGVDTFRGISIMLMIFVNYGGGRYWFMDHSFWNGLTVADLVFPWFVFVMGVTVALNLFKLSKNSMTRIMLLHYWLRAFKRTAILFMIGVALENPNSKLQTLRIMGPLQRLAIAYLCLVTTIFVVLLIGGMCKLEYESMSERTTDLLNSESDANFIDDHPCRSKIENLFPDIIKCFPYIILTIGFLVSHACISLMVQIDGCQKGYLGPGGIGDYSNQTNCTGGVAGAIDRLILKESHMYQTPTTRSLYKTTHPFDPEGILGNLTCTALCFLGFWAGNLMLLNKNWSAIVKRLFIYSIICAAAGTGLCEGKINGGFIPINKNLWSVSYVLVTAATGFFLMATIFFLVDVFLIWSGFPFKYLGMNPIVIYAGHIMFGHRFPIQWTLTKDYQNHTYEIIMNMWGVVFWTVVAFMMYRKRIFISV